MKIGIVTGFSLKHSAGLEQFLMGVLEGLEAVRPEGVEYLIYTSANSDIEKALVEHHLTSFRVIRLGFGSFWKQLGLFFAPRADAYLFNGPLVPIFFAPRRSYVITYDFAYKRERVLSLKERMHISLMDFVSAIAFMRATRVIAISEATKREVMRLFKTSSEKIAVVYPGVKDLSMVAEKLVSDLPATYFLFVGTAKERKNLLNLVLGFIEAVKAYNIPEHLLIVGRNDPHSSYGVHIMEAIQNSGISNRIRFLGRIDEGELRYLYTHAMAFTFPSALEGFGMPVVEAMLLGTPVLTSNVSSLPEAAGDAALLVAPDDIVGIADALERLNSDPTLRAELIQKGYENAKRFSWRECAEGLLEVVCTP